MMNNKILILKDYKGFFGSKQKTHIYRGGMDLNRIKDYFEASGFEVVILSFNEIDYPKLMGTKSIVLYTSSEDKGDYYKSYIEDVIYDLEEQGLKVIPKYSYLKAHNNKVAMELLRMRSGFETIQTIQSRFFGSLKELKYVAENLFYPVVIKSASGAMSRGVEKADNPGELIRKAKKISKSKDFKHDLKDFLRKIKYKNSYVKESLNRKKFLVQNLIPGLKNDWKVLVYSSKCFVLYRANRENDFRASGSGNFEFRKDIPEGMLDYAYSIKQYFNVPHISLDVAFDGNNFHLLEFQFIYFGTTTQEKAGFYFQKDSTGWILVKGKVQLEDIYSESVVEYIRCIEL